MNTPHLIQLTPKAFWIINTASTSSNSSQPSTSLKMKFTSVLAAGLFSAVALAGKSTKPKGSSSHDHRLKNFKLRV